MTLTPSHVRTARFGTAGRGELGYDEREVDDFLERAAAALAGGDTLTSQHVEAVQFTEHRHRGYPAREVDAFLDEVALTLSAGADTHERENSPVPVQRISVAPQRDRAEFAGPSAGEPTFDEDEVDALLDRITATLAGRDTLDAHDVLTATFNPPKPGRRGYGQRGVNAFLRVASASLDTLGSRTDKAGTQPTPAPPSSHVAEARPDAAAPRPRPSPARTPPAPPESSITSRGPLPIRQPIAPPPPDADGGDRDGVTRPGARPGPYDRREVDAFLDRLRATLTGKDHLTAEDVLAVVFPPAQPGSPSCSESEFLAVVAGLLETPGAPADPVPPASTDSSFPPLTAEDIRDIRFPPPEPGERGYLAAEVDDLLDRVEATLAGTDTVTAQDLYDVRFREAPPGEGGYDQAQVDDVLDLLADHLGARRAG